MAQGISRKTLGYIRVSTQDQVQNGFSLEAQQAKLQAYAVATDRTLDAIFTDAGASAGDLNRSGMQALLAAIRANAVECVLVIKLDRLTRSVSDLDTLLRLCKKHDVALVSVSESLDTSSAAGRMVLNIMTTVAQWEREAIGERTKTVLQHKREQRRVYSAHVPFGWTRIDDTLVQSTAEQAVLGKIRARRAKGQSYRTIAAWLNESGVPARQGGKQWYGASVDRVLRSTMASAG